MYDQETEARYQEFKDFMERFIVEKAMGKALDKVLNDALERHWDADKARGQAFRDVEAKVYICDDCLQDKYNNFSDVIKSMVECSMCKVYKSCTDTSHFQLKPKE